MLLFPPLFRLALNIPTTRQILIHTVAGDIIQACRHFVVADNSVVSAVMFLIPLVVQLAVIIRGAECVSEVAARFRLDAMSVPLIVIRRHRVQVMEHSMGL
jgi:flagellar biosynthesis protein FlhA